MSEDQMRYGAPWAYRLHNDKNRPVGRFTQRQKTRSMRSPVYELRSPVSSVDWARYHDLRKTCLFDVYHPWIPYDPDYPDEKDPANHPLVFVRDGEVIGTVRVDFKPDRRAIFRMIAIAPEWRGAHLGGRLLDLAETFAAAHGTRTVCLNSVFHAYRFYSRHGFHPSRWEGCTACPTSIPVTKAMPIADPALAYAA